MGNLDQEVVHFEDALAFCRRAGYRPELAFDERQENGGNFMTIRGNTVIDESQEVGGYVASKRTPVQAMVIDESQEVGGV